MNPATATLPLTNPKSPRLGVGAFAILLFALLLAAYPQVWFATETFVFRDFGIFGHPLACYFRDRFWQGIVPLWNPLNNCGLPFLAQWNTMVLYPGSLFYLAFPLTWSLSVFCLLHQWLAGIGMFFLIQRWTQSQIAAAVSGVAFAFNGLTLNCLMWPNHMAVLAWMPWVVYAADLAWKRGGRYLLYAALLGALQMLAGTPELILFTWAFVGAGWGLHCLSSPGHRRTLLVRLGLLVSLVAVLSAIQLLPFLDLLAISQRHRTYADTGWSMPATGWANFIVPLFYMYPAQNGVYFQPFQAVTSSYYLGVIIVVLAVYAMWVVRRPLVLVWSAIFWAGAVLALGDHAFLYGLLRKVLPLGYIRFPIKYVFLTQFSGIVLAGWGLASFLEAKERAPKKAWRHLLGLAVALIVAIGLLVVFAYRYPQPAPYDIPFSVLRNNALNRILFLIAGGLAAGWLAIRQGSLHRWLASTILLLSLWLDLRTHVPDQNPTITPQALRPNLVEMKPRPVWGENRAMQSKAAKHDLYLHPPSDIRVGYLRHRLALNGNLNLLENIPKVDGFYALYPQEIQDLESILYSVNSPERPHIVRLLSVSQLTTPGSIGNWTPIHDSFPLIRIGLKPVFVEDRDSLKSLGRPLVDLQSQLLLPADAKAVLVPEAGSSGRILAQEFSDHQVRIEYESSGPILVSLTQTYTPRWQAYLEDGATAKIWRANHAFQAVQVPGGRHTLTLIYRDLPFFAGAMVSCAVLVLLGVWHWKARRMLRAASHGVTPNSHSQVWKRFP